MSQFSFLKPEFPTIYESAHKAFRTAYRDPRTACFYARRALELTVNWLYKYDTSLRLPYQDNLSALIHEPTFKTLVGQAIFYKAKLIIKIGNNAVHDQKPIPTQDAIIAIREFFHIAYWLGHTYGRTTKPDPSLKFDSEAIPKKSTQASASLRQAQDIALSQQGQSSSLSGVEGTATTAAQLQKLEQELSDRDEKLSILLADKNAIDEELKRLRAELIAVKQANTVQPDTHDYSEAQTRDLFIDLLLKESGWVLASAPMASTPLSHRQKTSSLSEVEGTVNAAGNIAGNEGTANVAREFEVSGMPNETGKGFVDYVLWGDDGKPLAIVEAKRTKKDPRVGQQQAKLYADCLEAQFGQRPIIFYTNGYEHHIWDDTNYPPRQIQGFYKKSELELLIQRRTTQKPLSTANINPAIASRHYQARAIRKVSEAFEQNKERKVLIIMATGAGKTRTAIALVDLLMRCKWVKRALFLADRVSLVNQAIKVFKTHLPDSAPVNLLTEKETEGRVYASTYGTMMGLINDTKNGQKRFGVGHFDLIIIDEAHRSVFQKYRHIFNYFDCHLLGLTATPKDEIDRNTYGLFDLENGVPTDAYQLEDAVKDGYLVPTQAISVPLKFQREGIKYDELSESEKEEWDAMEWDEEGNIPDRIEAGALDQWLFNQDTADKVLEHLMTRGLKVAGGDRLGKTIIFAKNQKHAKFIEDRFNINYPHLKGTFARLITNKTDYAQTLIDDFSKKDKAPHIAISVDMLDTGIDVPEIVNLVLFKLVRSKTKFWQMVGRGTRLCPDLFGDGQDKQFFYLFDYCQNLEFFKQNVQTIDAPIPKSLGKQLFTTRLDLIAELDKQSSSLSESKSSSLSVAEGTANEVEDASEVLASTSLSQRRASRSLSVVEGTVNEAEDASGVLASTSLSQRRASRSLSVAEGSNGAPYNPTTNPESSLRNQIAQILYSEVAAMNIENFIVRPKRQLVEKYNNPETWRSLSEQDLNELNQEIAGLPAQTEPEAEEIKRFDILILKLQLAILRSHTSFTRLRDQVKAIANLLEQKSSIPLVQEQLELIQDIQTDEWWQDVTLPMLEAVRKRLRGLVKLIEKQERQPIYTNFEDEMGDETIVELPHFTSSDSFEKFRAKARDFLRSHQDQMVIFKLRNNKQLTETDLSELETILIENGLGNAEDLDRAKQESHGLGLFVRSLIGLDREVAKQEFGKFLTDKTLNANQIEFINMIIDYLTEHGAIAAERLYESPFTDFASQGIDSLFTSSQVDELFALLDDVSAKAAA
ncbi:DEAD/DEAH box helicase family protein [Pseudanabaena galeata UHCC 0370]|uniref:DEAD/DEAH box helicase family protein n=1 Tax=Pseudanabaena galeata UHCC 0370 TaxID=3110310 RepID=A0ABU5TNQ0_9CYAN|nr:DEAD/DEAH box helicase family protein [Pseudanabaena galeata]MEA5479661.1 DEAD/DEAH box helicase family protein [Pseudanabaena galeata UHCC 0370]